MSKFYPILIDIEGKDVLFVGGGKVAERKIRSLVEFGANVYVVSKEMTEGLRKLEKEGKIVYLGKDFSLKHLEDKFLVFVATDDKKLNDQVAKEAKRRGILVNSADKPEICDFILPSFLKRGDLIICVSTSGKSPALAKAIRKELEERYGEEYKGFLNIIYAVRYAMNSLDISEDVKKKVYDFLINSDLLYKIKKKDIPGVIETLERIKEVV